MTTEQQTMARGIRPDESAPAHSRAAHADHRAAAERRRFRFRPVLMGVSFAAGVVLGVLGTALHGNLHMIGRVHDGTVLPWGAALALLLCLLAQLWVGLRAGSLAEPTLMGVTTFTVVTIAYLWPGADQLMLPYSGHAMDLLPGPTIASLVWWLGSALVTLAAMLLVKWILARASAHNMTPRTTAAPPFSSDG